MRKIIALTIALMFIFAKASLSAPTETEIRGVTGLSQLCVKVVLHAPDVEARIDEAALQKEIADELRLRLPDITTNDNGVSCPDRFYVMLNLLKNEGVKGKLLGTAGNLEIALHRPVYLEDKTTRLPFAALWKRSVLFLNGPDDDIHAFVLDQLKRKIAEFAEAVQAARGGGS